MRVTWCYWMHACGEELEPCANRAKTVCVFCENALCGECAETCNACQASFCGQCLPDHNCTATFAERILNFLDLASPLVRTGGVQ